MRHKKIITLFVLVTLLALAAVVSAGDIAPDDTYHWQLNNGDDGYVLCANGQFTIQVNGHDSIHLICHSAGDSPLRSDER